MSFPHFMVNLHEENSSKSVEPYVARFIEDGIK